MVKTTTLVSKSFCRQHPKPSRQDLTLVTSTTGRPPPPPVRTSPRFSRATKAIIAFYLLAWVAFTILLWFNQRISAEEAIKLAEKYRRGNEDVYVRTNVVFGADGAVLHDGHTIISLHTISDGQNVTTTSRGSREAWM